MCPSTEEVNVIYLTLSLDKDKQTLCSTAHCTWNTAISIEYKARRFKSHVECEKNSDNNSVAGRSYL